MAYVITVLERTWHLLKEPWLQEESLWMILPLIIILILMHLYFGRYRSEELGWNSAFGNSISLLWISVILFKFLFDTYSFSELYLGAQFGKFVAVCLLTLWVLIMFTFNFFHILPKRIAFVISSAGSVYVLAYIVIALIVGDFVYTSETIVAAILLFVLFIVVIQLLKHIVPMTRSAKQVLEHREKKKTRKQAGKKAARTKQWKSFVKTVSKDDEEIRFE